MEEEPLERFRPAAVQVEDRLVEQIEAALPGYEVGGELGRGGVGVVVEARHVRLDRRVAIKRLPQALARDANIRKRFLNEARLLAALDHPHIVPIFDLVDDDGVCLVVMEHLSGGSLEDWRRREPLGRGDACAAVLAASTALAFAHEQHILHRDIKPANLMLSARGVLKVVDFGIAKVLGGNESLATAAGDVLGSPAFMAPEQITGDPISAATDVYALATVLYELLSGTLPFVLPETQLQLLVAKVHREPIDLGRVCDLPPPLVEVAMQGLARDPRDRFSSAEAFGVALARAATEALGPGWLTGDRQLFATGALVRALDDAHADLRPPASLFSVPRPSTPAPGSSVIASEQLSALVPLSDVVARAGHGHADGVASMPRAAPGDTVATEVRTELLAAAMTASTTVPLVEPPEAVPAPLRFEVHEPGRSRRVVQIDGTTVFGRAGEGVVLVDDEISRAHFSIERTDEGFVLDDLGSTNGTYCNSARLVRPHVLQVGDVIDVGDTRLLVIS